MRGRIQKTVFAATSVQLFETTNGGLTWTRVNMGASNAIRDLDIDPLSSNSIYVALFCYPFRLATCVVTSRIVSMSDGLTYMCADKRTPRASF